MTFSDQLIKWYHLNRRDLPWRNTRDPYAIWLSEIILQQTRVAQGLPYYEKFIQAFPTVQDLAKAPQEQVLKLWQGLGYYSRARNLQFAAQQIVDKGSFPNNYKELLTLKGVGPYTAAAIASFAYKEPVAVVDGNVFRVLARVYGVQEAINETIGIKKFQHLAQQQLNVEDPATHNQAIMEFGALQCTPASPNCGSCPLSGDCAAFQTGKVQELPVKIKKTKVKNVHLHYLVVVTPQGNTMLHQRPETGIWAGLYEFPYIEGEGPLLATELREHAAKVLKVEGSRFRESVYNQQPIIHKLSHRKIHAYFWIIETDDELPEAMPVHQARTKPVPVLMERFLEIYFQN